MPNAGLQLSLFMHVTAAMCNFIHVYSTGIPRVRSMLAHMHKCPDYSLSGAWRHYPHSAEHGWASGSCQCDGCHDGLHCTSFTVVCWLSGELHLGSFQTCCRVGSLALTTTFKKAWRSVQHRSSIRRKVLCVVNLLQILSHRWCCRYKVPRSYLKL